MNVQTLSTKLAGLAAVLSVLITSLGAQQAATVHVKNLSNPPGFQNFAASPSPAIRFWLSPQGIELAKSSNHPNLRGMMKRFGVDPGVAPALPARTMNLAPAAATPALSAA